MVWMLINPLSSDAQMELKTDSRVADSLKYIEYAASYNKGSLTFDRMKWLATEAAKRQDHKLAQKVADDYLTNYLVKLPETELFTKANFQFAYQFTRASDSKMLTYFLHQPAKVDSALGIKGAAMDIVNFIISKEEIDSHLFDEQGKDRPGDPDWRKMEASITKKYGGEYAAKNILGAQVRWYKHKKDTMNLVKYTISDIKANGMDTVGRGRAATNNRLYYIVFKHVNDPEVLNLGIRWMEILLRLEPDNAAYKDTYANLLYKVGRKKEALKWEAESYLQDPKNRETADAYDKMKRGEKTWQ